MPERTVDFEVAYDDVIIDHAARAFVRRLFMKYLWLLVAACVLNIIGFILVLIFPGGGKFGTAAVGLIAALGPVYFPWAYRRLPGKFAAAMKTGLKPTAAVSVGSSAFAISAKGRSFTKRWTDMKAIEELPDYFLLVVAPLAFTFIPKKDMPLTAQQLIREASQQNAPKKQA